MVWQPCENADTKSYPTGLAEAGDRDHHMRRCFFADGGPMRLDRRFRLVDARIRDAEFLRGVSSNCLVIGELRLLQRPRRDYSWRINSPATRF
jgi:hypothetical protein